MDKRASAYGLQRLSLVGDFGVGRLGVQTSNTKLVERIQCNCARSPSDDAQNMEMEKKKEDADVSEVRFVCKLPTVSNQHSILVHAVCRPSQRYM